jgi:hypothetical protein
VLNIRKITFHHCFSFNHWKKLWIIDKNTPYADPEAGLSSGNVQGYQSGAYPSIREIGASLKLQF